MRVLKLLGQATIMLLFIPASLIVWLILPVPCFDRMNRDFQKHKWSAYWFVWTHVVLIAFLVWRTIKSYDK